MKKNPAKIEMSNTEKLGKSENSLCAEWTWKLVQNKQIGKSESILRALEI